MGYYNLLDEIKYDAYSRYKQGNKLNNFDKTLPSPQDTYIFDITTLKEDYVENEFELAMVDKIKMTLLELGNDFSFVGNQYRLTIDNEDYFIDLLFYHIRLHCYIAIELKSNKFKPEHIDKMNVYLSAVENILKGENDNPSIGLILCKDKK